MEFLNILFDKKDLVERALEVDERVMKDNFTSSDFFSTLEKISVLGVSPYMELKNEKNTLIIYDGNPFETIRILLSINKDGNFILFPNHSYLGINSLICKAYNMTDSNTVYLDTAQNYNRYLATKSVFSSIYVIGCHQEYIEISHDFKEAKWIEKKDILEK